MNNHKIIVLFNYNNNQILTKNEFIKLFNNYTLDYFVNINWNNILVYGDAVLFNVLKNNNINNVNLPEIKIILYGLNKKEYLNKIIYLHNFFSKKINFTFNFCNTNNNLIFYYKYPFKNIKINLKRIKNKKDVFNNDYFDNIYYDGDKIIINQKTLNIINNTNLYVNKKELIKYHKCFDLNLNNDVLLKYGLDNKYKDLCKILVINQNYNIKLIDNIKYNIYKMLNILPFGKEYSLDYINKFIDINNYNIGTLDSLINYKSIKKNDIKYKIIEQQTDYLRFFKNKNINNFKIKCDYVSHYLVRNNKFEIFKDLFLNNGLNVNSDDTTGFNIIHIASQRGSLDFITFLYNIDKNIINKKDKTYNLTSLFLSVIFNKFKVFEFLWNCAEINKNYIWITNKTSFSLNEIIIKLDRRNIFLYLVNNNKNIKLENYLLCIEYNNLSFFKILNKKNKFDLIKNNNILEYSLKKYKENIINKEFLIFILKNKNNIIKEENKLLKNIIETFDIEIIEITLKKFNINYILENNLTCLNIIRNSIKKFKVDIINKENDIKLSIWRKNMIKKYPFLLSEFNDIMDDNNDIQILNKYINNLNKIQKLIIDNEGKYNPKEKIITPKEIDSNIFYGEKYDKDSKIIDLFNFIHKKEKKKIRSFIFNNKNIVYAELYLKYSNRTFIDLLIENNCFSELKYIIDIIFKQCIDGLYNYVTKRDEFINFNNYFKFKNNYKYPVFNFLINNIFFKNKNSFFKNISNFKSFECLDVIINNENIHKESFYKYFYSIEYLFYNIKNYNIGLSSIIINKIINNPSIMKLNDLDNILVETIKYSNVKLFTHIITNFKDKINLNYKDKYNNNLIHILINKNYDLIKTSLIFKILFKSNELLLYDENDFGITPFNNICILNDIKFLKNIIQHNISFDEYDKRGLSLIHYSIINNSTNIFKFLVDKYEYVCKLETRKEKITPIMLCIIHDRVDMTRYIFSKSNLNHKDIYGNTNYHYLIMYSRIKLLSFIDKHNEENYVGITPNEYKIRNLIMTLYNNKDTKSILSIYEKTNKIPFELMFSTNKI